MDVGCEVPSHEDIPPPHPHALLGVLTLGK